MRSLAVLACVALSAVVSPAQALTFNYSGTDFSGPSDFASPSIAATAVFTQVDASTVSLTLSLANGIPGDRCLLQDAVSSNYAGSLAGITAIIQQRRRARRFNAMPGDFVARRGRQIRYQTWHGSQDPPESRLSEGDMPSTILFTGTGILADLFNSLSDPQGDNGQYLSALHIQGIVTDGGTSGFFAGVVPNGGGGGGGGVVPLPGAVLLVWLGACRRDRREHMAPAQAGCCSSLRRAAPSVAMNLWTPISDRGPFYF